MYDNDVYKRYIHQCGGSIINKYQILTAAHCFQKSQNPQDWIVIVGKNDIYMPKLHKGTVFENLPKNRIQHCERSELRLHFE